MKLNDQTKSKCLESDGKGWIGLASARFGSQIYPEDYVHRRATSDGPGSNAATQGFGGSGSRNGESTQVYHRPGFHDGVPFGENKQPIGSLWKVGSKDEMYGDNDRGSHGGFNGQTNARGNPRSGGPRGIAKIYFTKGLNAGISGPTGDELEYHLGKNERYDGGYKDSGSDNEEYPTDGSNTARNSGSAYRGSGPGAGAYRGFDGDNKESTYNAAKSGSKSKLRSFSERQKETAGKRGSKSGRREFESNNGNGSGGRKEGSTGGNDRLAVSGGKERPTLGYGGLESNAGKRRGSTTEQREPGSHSITNQGSGISRGLMEHYSGSGSNVIEAHKGSNSDQSRRRSIARTSGDRRRPTESCVCSGGKVSGGASGGSGLNKVRHGGSNSGQNIQEGLVRRYDGSGSSTGVRYRGPSAEGGPISGDVELRPLKTRRSGSDIQDGSVDGRKGLRSHTGKYGGYDGDENRSAGIGGS